MAILKKQSLGKLPSLGSFRLSKHDKDAGVKRNSSWENLWSSFSSIGSQDGALEGCSPARRQIHKCRRSTRRTRCTFKDFLQYATPEDTSALVELVETDDRKWKQLTFQETVQGDHYRQWHSKKNSLYRQLMNVAEAKNIEIEIEGLVDIGFHKMSTASIVNLLSELRKDATVRVLKFSGPLEYQSVDRIVRALETLLMCDERPWNAVIFQARFGAADPADYNKWKRTMQRVELQLGDMAITNNVPIRVDVWQK